MRERAYCARYGCVWISFGTWSARRVSRPTAACLCGMALAHTIRMAKMRKRVEDPEVSSFGAPQNAGDTTVAALDRDRVAQRAYELYLARGGVDGMDMDDWLAAERELANEE